MRFPDRFPDAYEKAFSERLFEGALGSPIAIDEVRRGFDADRAVCGGYCFRRFDSNGHQLEPFQQENELLDLLSSGRAPRRIFVTGDAGCGKSTFLRFVFGFVRFYWECIRASGVAAWFARPPKCCSNPHPTEMTLIDVQLEESVSVDITVRTACIRIRNELLKLYPGLLNEDEWALIRSDRNLESRPDEDLRSLLKRQENILRMDDDRATDMCRMAFQYLRFHREPYIERRPLVLVIDDSDLMQSDHVCEVMRALEHLFAVDDSSSGAENRGAGLSIIHSLRIDTYDMRFEPHMQVSSNYHISLASVDRTSVSGECGRRLVEEIRQDSDDLEDEIAPDDHAVYLIPIPASKVPHIAERICDASSGGFAQNAPAKHVASTIIAPLGGDSIRRVKRCQRRIASSAVVENRIRAGETVSNYDVMVGLIVGKGGGVASLDDVDGVGEWFPRGTDPNEKYLQAGYVIGTLASQRDVLSNYRMDRISADATSLLLGKVTDMVEKLIRQAYIGRPTRDGRFKFNAFTLKALLDLIVHPAYVDLSAARNLGVIEQVHRGRRSASPAEAKTTFDRSLHFLRELAHQELVWKSELQARCLASGVHRLDCQECVSRLTLPVMSQRIQFGYVERMEALATNTDLSYELRSVADNSKQAFLTLGPLVEKATWNVSDLGI